MSEIDLEAIEPRFKRPACYWLVGNDSRPCANIAHHVFGRMTFCTQHAKDFLPAVLAEIHESPKFRDLVIAEMDEYDIDEAHLWTEHRKQIRPLTASGPWRAHAVYFAERDGFVKIGRTSNIDKRMHDVGKGSCMPQGMSVGPVKLLAVIYCDCITKGCVREKHFHDKFGAQWLEGEWFLLDLQLASFIGGLPDCLDDRLRDVSAVRNAA